MNTRKKWIIAAVILLGAGIITCGIVFAAAGFDLTKLSNANYQTSTYEISEPFRSISILADTDDIVLAPSEDGKCTVVCLEEENRPYEVLVKDDTLTINSYDSKNWLDYSFFAFQSPCVTVYLPADEYEVLFIGTSTGSVDLPEELLFKDVLVNLSTGSADCRSSAKNNMEITASTGDIKVEGSSAEQMKLSVSTGTIRVNSVSCEGTIDANVTTGGAILENVTCGSVQSTGSTGDLYMKDTTASGEFRLERSTGDIRFENSDAGTITAKTSTGDVTGTLCSDKVFIINTSTGSVKVPASTQGGKCEISTGTGDIHIEIASYF